MADQPLSPEVERLMKLAKRLRREQFIPSVQAGVLLDLWEAAYRLCQQRSIDACLGMADRYDIDFEGCDADELLEYGEGLRCSFRLAYIIKYGTFPPDGGDWRYEFGERMKAIRKSAPPAVINPGDKIVMEIDASPLPAPPEKGETT